MAPSVSALRRALQGAEYPASREELADLAESNGADDDVIEALRDTDAEDFDAFDEVVGALSDELGDDDDE
jgi:hypothetical protein